MSFSSMRPVLWAVPLTGLLISCGGGDGGQSAPPPPPTYTIGGTVTGLAGTGLTLQSSGGPDLAVNANGTFTFATALTSGAAYNVVVKTRPATPSQTCTVAKGSGTVDSSNVATVVVTCVTDEFSVSGSVSGLNGSGLTLKNNGSDDVAVAANGTFAFSQKVLSGAPYEISIGTQPSNPPQLCTVTKAKGLVANENVADVAIACANTYSIGGTVSGLVGSGLVLQNNAGDDLTVAANGAFSFQTRIPVGSAYAVTVKTGPSQPVQTCSVASASGSVSNSAVTNVTVTCQTDRFAYVTNSIANTISIYTINSVNGALTPAASSPFAQAGGPVAMAFEPSNRFAYVVNTDANTVSTLAVDPVTGALTLIGTEGAGVFPSEIAVDPLGKFVFVSSYTSQSLAAYFIDPTTGTLATPAGFPINLGASVRELVVDATGNFLYVADQGGNALLAYAIDRVTGSLAATAGSPFPTGASPLGVTIDPANEFLYAVNNGDSTLSAYSLDSSTGALTPLAGSPFGATSSACSMTIDPQNRFAFVANSVIGSPGSLSTFSLAATGIPTQVSGSPVAAGTSPCWATVDPTGRFVYAANSGSEDVSAYAINQTTGVLTPLQGSPYKAGAGAGTIVIR